MTAALLVLVLLFCTHIGFDARALRAIRGDSLVARHRGVLRLTRSARAGVAIAPATSVLMEAIAAPLARARSLPLVGLVL